MTFTLVFLGFLMAAVVWWLLRQTINVQPWAANNNPDYVRASGVQGQDSKQLVPAKLALGVFLAVVTSLFALFISAYFIRMEIPDWRPLQEPRLLWLNTGVLVLGSVALQWSLYQANASKVAAVRKGLVVSLVATLGFIFGQLLAWQQLTNTGFLVSSNPANAFFYTLTALHALHMLGGLVALRKTWIKAWGDASLVSLRLSLELCTVYWHYLLMVWLILFGLLLST